MNYGPLVFLAAFFALAGSWFGLVLTPQVQLGDQQPTNTLGMPTLYPVLRPGLARQGLAVYRANGCADCHSQQVTQTGTVCNLLLTEAGTNHAPLLAALEKLKPGLTQSETKDLLVALPKPILEGVTREKADAAISALKAAGAKTVLQIVPFGPDIARGWGRRRTVAEDFLYDYPVMPGSQRIGPDLANVGMRLPDANWHLRHLYAPNLDVNGSLMPAFPFLFEKRKVQRSPSPDALALPPSLAPAPGYEIVPRPEAGALVAYLLSLRADAPLFQIPLTVAAAVAPPADTNAPAGAPVAPGAASAPAAPAQPPAK